MSGQVQILYAVPFHKLDENEMYFHHMFIKKQVKWAHGQDFMGPGVYIPLIQDPQ